MLRVAGLCAGNSPVTGEFPAQRASDAENASILWRHHVPHDFIQAQGKRPLTKPLLTMALNGVIKDKCAEILSWDPNN